MTLDELVNGLDAQTSAPRDRATVAAEVQALLADGASIEAATAACQLAKRTYYNWVYADATIASHHAHALRIRADVLAEHQLDLADRLRVGRGDAPRHAGTARQGATAAEPPPPLALHKLGELTANVRLEAELTKQQAEWHSTAYTPRVDRHNTSEITVRVAFDALPSASPDAQSHAVDADYEVLSDAMPTATDVVLHALANAGTLTVYSAEPAREALE